MKVTRFVLPALALLLGCANMPGTPSPAGVGLEPFEWLIGDWISEGERNRTHESWRWAEDGALAGVGRSESLATGEIRITETVRLVASGNEILYIPTVDHNPGPVAFRLVQRIGDDFVFENPEHDFPKRIVYRQLADDRMRVTVSGDDSSGFTVEFSRRVKN